MSAPLEQLQLADYQPAQTPALRTRLDDLASVLRGKGWMTRRQLEERGFNERELREITELDEEALIFSYPGSPGYKLFDEVTHEEFDHCAALKKQGDKMRRKWIRFQRRWHRSMKRS